MWGGGFSAVWLIGPVTPLAAFHLSMASRKEVSESSTALVLTRPSAVPEMNKHLAGAAVGRVRGAQQAMATMASNTLRRIQTPLQR